LLCFFVTDMHGKPERYRKLFAAVLAETPSGVFLGGDLLPNGHVQGHEAFLEQVLVAGFDSLRRRMGGSYPEVFLILGNDDGRADEEAVRKGEARGLWKCAHGCRHTLGGRPVYGYAFVPPSPFLLKDWERYDVSRYVDPGCLSPEDGIRSVPVPPEITRYSTIARDLDALCNGEEALDRAIFLFHSPPHDTPLDRAALDGKTFDHVPLDVHVGSIAIRRFLESRGPCVSLHGHIHESARLTGAWKTQIGRTWAMNAAHDGPELSLVRFDPDRPEEASRELI